MARVCSEYHRVPLDANDILPSCVKVKTVLANTHSIRFIHPFSSLLEMLSEANSRV